MSRESSSKVNDLFFKWRYNPYSFVTEALGAKPLDFKKDNPHTKTVTTQQKEVLDILGKYAYVLKKKQNNHEILEEEKYLLKKMGISIKSGKGPGKTTLMAWSVIWFLCCFPKSVIPCTAPKLDQVKDVLWREVAKWIDISRKEGKYGDAIFNSIVIQGEKIYMDTKVGNIKGNSGKEWYAIARSASTSQSPDAPAETLQGFHAEHMMIIVDEASGVPDNVFMPLDTTLTDICNFMLMTYNPNRTSGFAYRSHHNDRMDWICFRWNCEESENVSQESIERVARKYGKDSNAYRINVLGLEPVGDNESVIPLEWVQNAVERDIVSTPDDPTFSGVDVARQGGDKSIIITRHGNVFDKEIKSFNGLDTMQLAGWVNLHISEERPRDIAVDVVGMGYGVYDRVREVGNRIVGVNVAESTTNKAKFERLRDELWWRTREEFQKGTISIPNDEELIFELSNVKYEVRSNGKIKIESKKEMKRRGVQSPNKADALVLTYYFLDSTYREPLKGFGKYGSKMKSNPYTTSKSWMTI